MKFAIMAMALSALSVSAVAQGKGVELWNGIYTSTTKEEVRERFPTKQGWGIKHNRSILLGGGTVVPIKVSESCSAEVSIVHSGGPVSAVQLSPLFEGHSAASCGIGVLAGLRAKYGEPQEVTEPNGISRTVWSKDGLCVDYRESTEKWLVTYKACEEVNTSLL